MDRECLRMTAGLLNPFNGSSSSGLTLVELILVVAIIGTLSGIAVPAYTSHVRKTESQKAISDILHIELSLEKYYAENGRYPDSLAEVGKAGMTDPWRNQYQYLKHPTAKPKKLTNIIPINSVNDYDLWSNGQDGRTNQALTADMCQDDIIRAFDGAYVGLVEDLR